MTRYYLFRLYLRVTNLDIKFKVWAFNPVKVMATIKGKDKTLIPEFIKDSTKPFHLYLNDVDRKDVAKVIKFIKTYINRVEGVKITLTEKDDYLLTKLAAMKPMWVNLNSFIVQSKSYENTNLEIFPMLFHCQNTLQELDFAYVVIKFKKGLMFSCLKSLTVNYCENIVELIRSTSPQLEKLHITQFSNISITGNFSKLKEFKSCGPKLEWENIKEILSNCEKTIQVLDVSSCIQSHQIENLQQLKFKKLRKIKLTDFNEVYSNKIVKLMADCALTLQEIAVEFTLYI